jgi:hypothetical protein
MFDVIEFLEHMGADASLRNASAVEVAQALRDAGIAASASTAIVERDVEELREIMQLHPMFCLQTAGNDHADAGSLECDGTYGKHTAKGSLAIA